MMKRNQLTDFPRPENHETQRDVLVTVPEAARRTGLGLRQFRRAIADGTLDVFDVGGWPRIKWQDVLSFIEAHRRPSRLAGP